MFRFSFVLLLFCFLIPTVSSASIEGIWTGEGELEFTPNGIAVCHIVEISIERNRQSVSMDEGCASCGNIQIRWPSSTMTLDDGVLFDRGVPVGIISDTSFHVHYRTINGATASLHLEKTADGAHLVFTESIPGRGHGILRAEVALEEEAK